MVTERLESIGAKVEENSTVGGKAVQARLDTLALELEKVTSKVNAVDIAKEIKKLKV